MQLIERHYFCVKFKSCVLVSKYVGMYYVVWSVFFDLLTMYILPGNSGVRISSEKHRLSGSI